MLPQEVIKNYEEQLKKAYEDAKVVSYPQTIFYPDEKKEITDLNKEELRAQKAEVENCGYHIVKEELCKLVENEALKSRQSVIKKIISCWETKGESIQRAVNVGFSKNIDTITIREKKLRKLKELSFLKDTIFRDGETLYRCYRANPLSAEKVVCSNGTNTAKPKRFCCNSVP